MHFAYHASYNKPTDAHNDQQEEAARLEWLLLAIPKREDKEDNKIRGGEHPEEHNDRSSGVGLQKLGVGGAAFKRVKYRSDYSNRTNETC